MALPSKNGYYWVENISALDGKPVRRIIAVVDWKGGYWGGAWVPEGLYVNDGARLNSVSEMSWWEGLKFEPVKPASFMSEPLPATAKVVFHPCSCTASNGGQCYNCLNGAHSICEGRPKCGKKDGKVTPQVLHDLITLLIARRVGITITTDMVEPLPELTHE